MESNEENDPLLSEPPSVETVNNSDDREKLYGVSSKRWFMLGVLTLLNFSNGMIWITFGSIADVTAEYFDVGANSVNWLSLIYIIVAVPLGFFAIWALDTRGLKKVIRAAAWINLIGCGIRIVSVFDSVGSQFKYPLLLSGQCIAAYAQPFIMFSTTKMAALWFPDEQRALANSISSMANPLGILAANVFAPLMVTNRDSLFWILELSALPAALGTFFTYMIVTSDRPKVPPSGSAENESETFLDGLKLIVKNRNYWVLCYSFGSGLALFTTLSTLLEQMLCSRGYSDEFSGLCVGLQIGVGFIGAAIAGVVVGKTKKFEEVTKIGFCLTSIAVVGFSLCSVHSHLEAVIAIMLAAVGLFGFGIYPVCLELAVECTYPVAEATSSGLLIISGQIQSIIFIVLQQALARPYHGDNSVCHISGPTGVLPQDYTVSNLVLSGLLVMSTLCIMLFFKCDYKRLNAERILLSERLVGSRADLNRPMLRYS